MASFKNKKVLIFGLGLNQGGVGSAKFFAKAGAKVRVTDLKTSKILKPSLSQLKKYPNIEFVLGEHRFEDIEWADLIIKNPAVKPGNSYIDYAVKKGKEVQMDMGIFLKFVKPEQLIGVTGTKGKSTTSSLIYEGLKAHSKDVIFVGNIGKSVLDAVDQITPKTQVVLELSSFQLEAFEKHQVSPHLAVITNIYPDHLNYYANMDEYIHYKRVITNFQTETDLLFIRSNDKIVDRDEFLSGLKTNISRFAATDLPKKFAPNLPGRHNLENMAAAFSVLKHLGANETKVLKTLAKFKGVEFRLQLVKTWRGIKIYNDTAATGPESAMQALQTLPGSIVIAGGMNKGMDYTEYAKLLAKNAKAVFFLAGDATDLILSALQGSNLTVHGPYHDLELMLQDVKSATKAGDIILLSPAATSFNLFQNEFDRGKKFNRLVQKIFA